MDTPSSRHETGQSGVTSRHDKREAVWGGGGGLYLTCTCSVRRLVENENENKNENENENERRGVLRSCQSVGRGSGSFGTFFAARRNGQMDGLVNSNYFHVVYMIYSSYSTSSCIFYFLAYKNFFPPEAEVRRGLGGGIGALPPVRIDSDRLLRLPIFCFFPTTHIDTTLCFFLLHFFRVQGSGSGFIYVFRALHQFKRRGPEDPSTSAAPSRVVREERTLSF